MPNFDMKRSLPLVQLVANLSKYIQYTLYDMRLACTRGQIARDSTVSGHFVPATRPNCSTPAQFLDSTYARGTIPILIIDRLLLTTQCLTGLMESAVSKYISRQVQKSIFCCLLTVSFIAFIIVLFDDYRLTINGILFALSGLIAYFFATSSIRSYDRMYLAPAQTASSCTLLRTLPLLTLFISMLITGCWASKFEDRTNLYHTLHLVDPVLLALNLAIAAIALQAQGRRKEPLNLPQMSRQHCKNESSASLTLFAELTTLLNNIMGTPGYSTVLQVGVFTVAILADDLGSRMRLTSTWHFQSPTSFYLALEESTNSTEDSPVFSQPQGSQRTKGSKDMPVRLHRLDKIYWAPHSNCVCVLLIWATMAFTNSLNFTSGLTQRIPPSLDLDYLPKVDMEIVISMYKEEIDSVASMVSRLGEVFDGKVRATAITVYVKDEHANTTELENRLGASSLVLKRPSIGREGETYLHHILSRFDTLATHSLFIQAHAHNFWEIRRRIEHYFVPNTGMLSLGFSGNSCDCGNCLNRWGLGRRSCGLIIL